MLILTGRTLKATAGRLRSPQAGAELIACELLLLFASVLGPTPDEQNRLAAALSMALVVAATWIVLCASALWRWRLLTALVVGGGAIASSLLFFVDPRSLQGPLAGLFQTTTPATGGLINRNTLGILLVPIPLGALSLIRGRGAPWASAMLTGVAVLGLTIELVAGSRTSLLGLVAGALAMFATRGRRQVWRVVVIGVAIVGLVTVGSLDEPAVRERAQIWRATGDAILAGLPGIGYGALPYVIPQHASAHSSLLQLVADFGLGGLLAILAVVPLFVASITRGLRCPVDTDERRIAGAALSCGIGIAVVALGESVISSPVDTPGGFLTIVSPIPFIVLAAPLGLASTRALRGLSASRLCTAAAAATVAVSLVAALSIRAVPELNVISMRIDREAVRPGELVPISMSSCVDEARHIFYETAVSFTRSDGFMYSYYLPQMAYTRPGCSSATWYAVNVPSDLPPGDYSLSGTLVVSEHGRPAVTHWRSNEVHVSGEPSPVHVFMDSPQPGTSATAVASASGWAVSLDALSGVGIDSVLLVVDGDSIAIPAALGLARPDVAAHFGRSDAVLSGWSASFANLPAGSHVLTAVARDDHGALAYHTVLLERP